MQIGSSSMAMRTNTVKTASVSTMIKRGITTNIRGDTSGVCALDDDIAFIEVPVCEPIARTTLRGSV
jgi:hypothetical protein